MDSQECLYSTMNAASEPQSVWKADVLQWVPEGTRYGTSYAAAVATPAGPEEEHCTHLSGPEEGADGRYAMLKAGG